MARSDDSLRSFFNSSNRQQLPSTPPSLFSSYLPDIPPKNPSLFTNYLQTPLGTRISAPSPFSSTTKGVLLKILSPQLVAEKKLKTELLDIIKHNFDLSLARIIPSLDSLAFADGKDIDIAVLYIDIRNSSKITNSHSSENAAKIYKVFHKAMIFAGKKYGGEIGGFAGDRIMIVFPLNPSKHPRANAVKTAIYMQYILSQLVNLILNNDIFQHTLNCGIGIDFGKVLVVKVGQAGSGNNDRIWTGDAANYASKLAELGSGIYTSPEVYDGLKIRSLISGNRTWMQWTDKEGNLCYKYTGVLTPV